MSHWKELLLDHIKAIETYQGVESPDTIAAKTGINIDDIIKLNGNENPYGFSAMVKTYLGNYDNYNLYPDPNQEKLRHTLAEYAGTDYQNIVAGNGADELIDLLIRIFVGIGDEVIIPTPTFGMYSFGTEIVGGRVINVPRDDGYDINVKEIIEAITDRTKIIFLSKDNQLLVLPLPPSQTLTLYQVVLITLYLVESSLLDSYLKSLLLVCILLSNLQLLQVSKQLLLFFHLSVLDNLGKDHNYMVQSHLMKYPLNEYLTSQVL